MSAMQLRMYILQHKSMYSVFSLLPIYSNMRTDCWYKKSNRPPVANDWIVPFRRNIFCGRASNFMSISNIHMRTSHNDAHYNFLIWKILFPALRFTAIFISIPCRAMIWSITFFILFHFLNHFLVLSSYCYHVFDVIWDH